MGRIYQLNMETTSPFSVEKLSRAFIADYENLIPVAAPRMVQSIEKLQGDGGPGSTRKIYFAPEQKYTYAKIEVVKLDKEKFIFKFVVTEGDVLGEVILKIEVEIKIEISPEEKSILKVEIFYYTKDDFELSNEYIQAVNNNVFALYNAVEAYFFDH